MTPASLIEACVRKGIQVLGSGDALHPVWRAAWKEFTGEPGVIVVPTTEIEGPGRVHHLVLMESFEQFAELATLLEPYAKGIRTNGRPRVDLPAGEIGAFVHDLGGAIGPSHAFTPWTSLYAYFDRLTDCYGTEPVDFLELGLSADSSYGAAIQERGCPSGSGAVRCWSWVLGVGCWPLINGGWAPPTPNTQNPTPKTK